MVNPLPSAFRKLKNLHPLSVMLRYFRSIQYLFTRFFGRHFVPTLNDTSLPSHPELVSGSRKKLSLSKMLKLPACAGRVQHNSKSTLKKLFIIIIAIGLVAAGTILIPKNTSEASWYNDNDNTLQVYLFSCKTSCDIQ